MKPPLKRGRFFHREGLVCSQCGKLLDGWTATNAFDSPVPSTDGKVTISICAECGALAEFVGNPIRLRPLVGEELAKALADEGIKRMRAAVLTEIALRNAGWTVAEPGGGKTPLWRVIE